MKDTDLSLVSSYFCRSRPGSRTDGWNWSVSCKRWGQNHPSMAYHFMVTFLSDLRVVPCPMFIHLHRLSPGGILLAFLSRQCPLPTWIPETPLEDSQVLSGQCLFPILWDTKTQERCSWLYEGFLMTSNSQFALFCFNHVITKSYRNFWSWTDMLGRAIFCTDIYILSERESDTYVKTMCAILVIASRRTQGIFVIQMMTIWKYTGN